MSDKIGDMEMSDVGIEETRPRKVADNMANTVLFQEDDIQTEHGTVHVAVEGNRSKPAILTYHDLGLNHVSCFQGFFNHPDMKLLLQHFCVYHVNAPGQEEGAVALPEAYVYPTMDQLAEMLPAVMEHYKLKRAICFGVGAGANILSRFALKHPKMVDSLVLINCSASQSGWIEWGYQKLNSWYMKGGVMTHFCEDYLLWHWFGNETMQTNADLVHAYLKDLKKINIHNLALFTDSYIKRSDIGIIRELDPLKKKTVPNFSCEVMLVVGMSSPHIDDVVAMNGRLDPTKSTWIELADCGGMVLEEQPGRMAESLRLFLQGMGYVPCLSQAKIQAIHHSQIASKPTILQAQEIM